MDGMPKNSSSTDPEGAAALAGAVFDEVVIPAAAARKAAGRPPAFAMGPDPAAQSYYDAPDSEGGRLAVFDFPGGGRVEGLIDALEAHWATHGDADLARALAPALRPVAAALREQGAAHDGEVDIFCYTLF